MKKRLLKLLFWVVVLIITIAILNIKVSTRQGINFRVHTLKIPLYLKILDFFDRHYNYQWVVQRIIGNSKTDEEKASKIFQWTYENIKKAPEGYPIVDDHVWHIMVRGYGVSDQLSDVFTTLCNYAGIEAFYDLVFAKDRSSCIYLAFVKVDKRWVAFDPYNGIYFKSSTGELASIEQIKSGNWAAVHIIGIEKSDFNYKAYFVNLFTIKNIGFKRANIQSPFKRLLFELKKWKK